MGQGMAARRRLEPDSARQQTPVKFRKGDIHRQITRRQSGAGRVPVAGKAGGKHELKHRGVDRAEGAG